MYINVSARLNAARDLRWYLASDILEYIHQLREDLQIGRLTLTHQIDNITTTAPFGECQRFPEGCMYICEGIGAWNDRLQEIQRYAIMTSCPNRLLREYPKIHSRGEAETLLLQLISQFLQAYEATEDFIDRRSFEQRYNLTWKMDEPNND